MRRLTRISVLLLAAFTLLFLAGCVPIPTGDQGLVIGDSYRLESGKTLNNDLTVIGGNATLMQDSTVNGDVAVIGGNVTIDGKVNGDVSAIGGFVSLTDHANITGSVSTLGGTVDRSSQAVVEGKTPTRTNQPGPVTTFKSPAMQVSVDPITGPLIAIFQALALAALAVVVNLFAPMPMERASHTALTAPAAAGGVGCLTILVLLIMAITIILLPVSLLGFLVLGIAVLFGWLALGLLLGRQLAVWLNQPWSDPINAGAGTLVLSLLVSLMNIIPCIGWTGSALVGLVALGAVVLSRFGTQIYPPPYSSTAPYTSTAPYAPPPAQSGGAHIYGPESDQPANSQE